MHYNCSGVVYETNEQFTSPPTGGKEGGSVSHETANQQTDVLIKRMS